MKKKSREYQPYTVKTVVSLSHTACDYCDNCGTIITFLMCLSKNFSYSESSNVTVYFISSVVLRLLPMSDDQMTRVHVFMVILVVLYQHSYIDHHRHILMY